MRFLPVFATILLAFVTVAQGQDVTLPQPLDGSASSVAVFPVIEENPTPPKEAPEAKKSLGPKQATQPETPDPAEVAKQTAELAKTVEELGKRVTVLTATTDERIVLGGAITADFLWNEARPVGPGTPFFLTPRSPFGLNQRTFDAHARQTSLFAMLTGPKVCGWETGGLVSVNFYNDAVLNDRYGLLPIEVYGEIKDHEWRFAAGLQLDIFNPLNPTVLPFSLLLASGNTGDFRGQARVEHFIHPSDDSQITLTVGISEPVPTELSRNFDISEDNGWPNVESRIALALGPLCGEGSEARRPFEVGVSGVIGQIRTTSGSFREVADVWGLGADLRCDITDWLGVQGEYYTGQTLGTYGGSIMQDVNATTFEGIRSTGGWAEVYVYWLGRCLHSHTGFGIDDPRKSDLAPLQLAKNETAYVNLIYDATEHLRFGWELAYRKTEYIAARNNDGLGVQTQVQWKF